MKQLHSAFLIVAFCCVFLFSCGSGSPNTPAKRRATEKDAPEQKECPTTPPSNSHIVTLNFTQMLPANMALKLEGDPDFRISDCAEKTQTGVLASWARTSNMQLRVMVDHRSAFNNKLPDTESLELFDLGSDCKMNPPASFYKTAVPLQIRWRTELVMPGCPQSRAVGEAAKN